MNGAGNVPGAGIFGLAGIGHGATRAGFIGDGGKVDGCALFDEFGCPAA